MFCSKIFREKYELVVAICDEELIGKQLRKKPPFKATENFYFEKKIDEKKALELMKKATIGNLLGKKIVDLALKNKFITEENLILIGGVPHAQFVK